MPQPPAVEAIRDELLELYAQAQRSIDARLAAILANPDELLRRERLRRRLTELSRSIDQQATDLDRQARRWLSSRYPEAYKLGIADAVHAGGRPFTGWAAPHVDAIGELANDAYADLLTSTRFMRRDAKALIRAASRSAARASIVEGDTAVQAGRALARELGERGIKAVRYSNGARHGIGDYAGMVIRTKTAEAYALGSINGGESTGVRWFECFDGADCGLTAHDDGEKVNGRVYPASVARSHLLAHPNCARSWSPRPDVRKQGDADSARRFTDEEQARAAIEERNRALGERQRPGNRPAPRLAARQERLSARAQGLAARAANRAKPAGTPITPAVQARGQAAAPAAHALRVIDSVHGDGILEPLPVRTMPRAQFLDGKLGSYEGYVGGGPVEVLIAPGGDHPELTAAHEFGHWLDHQAMGLKGHFGSQRAFGSALSPEWEDWARAVDGSRALAELRRMPLSANARQYYTTPAEIWARSYAQYIARRSGDRVMVDQLEAMLAQRSRPDYIPSQWADDDFEPVMTAIDKLLTSLGWRK